jgi:Phospholipase_D-nuclease N-terminal
MLAALVLLGAFALVVGWEVLCLAEVIRAGQVRFLPRWVWAVACLLMIPFGGILYLLVGRVWGRAAARRAGP